MVVFKYSRLINRFNMKHLIIIAIYFISSPMLAQVGIGTENPDAILDINGTVRVTDIPVITIADPSQGIGGISTANKINKTELGINIFLSYDDGLITAPVAKAMGNRIIISADYSSGIRIDDMDIYLGPDEINENTTFIIVSGYTSTTKLGGISGGYHGRRITLYFSEEVTVFSILEENNNSISQNRFFTLSTSQLTINGNGLVELVYDENAGDDGLGRWIVIKFRS